MSNEKDLTRRELIHSRLRLMIIAHGALHYMRSDDMLRAEVLLNHVFDEQMIGPDEVVYHEEAAPTEDGVALPWDLKYFVDDFREYRIDQAIAELLAEAHAEQEASNV